RNARPPVRPRFPGPRPRQGVPRGRPVGDLLRGAVRRPSMVEDGRVLPSDTRELDVGDIDDGWGLGSSSAGLVPAADGAHGGRYHRPGNAVIQFLAPSESA